MLQISIQNVGFKFSFVPFTLIHIRFIRIKFLPDTKLQTHFLTISDTVSYISLKLIKFVHIFTKFHVINRNGLKTGVFEHNLNRMRHFLYGRSIHFILHEHAPVESRMILSLFILKMKLFGKCFDFFHCITHKKDIKYSPRQNFRFDWSS